MTENKKRICICKSVLDSLVKKTNWFRNGKRFMIQKKGCIGVSFFRRYDPEKKFLKMNFEPDIECSVADLLFGIAGIFALVTVIKSVVSVVRVIKCRLG